MTDLTDKNMFENITGETEVTEKQEETDDRFRGEETDTRSTTTEECPECGNDKAYYELQQIRAADESETRFFECVNCSYKWREDDH